MNLYERLPESVIVGGKRYAIRPSWDRMLEAYDVLQNDWTDAEKIDYVSWLLFWKPPVDKLAGINAVFDLFRTDKANDGEKTFDFKQDCQYIYGAFWQAYQIRLQDWRDTRKNQKDQSKWLHWSEFLSLFASLPEDTRMSEIISIRTRPLPKPTRYNAEEIANLMRVKAAYALEKTEEERQRQFAEGAKKLFGALEGMANARKD